MRYFIQPVCALLLAVILFFTLCCPSFAEGDVGLLVIANPGVPVDSLSQAVVANIYQGHKGKWNDGQKIKVVMLKQGATHEAFAESMVQLTPAKLKTLWKKVIFSGAGSPPKILRSEEKCVQYVAATKGAIGYISSVTSHDGVKVIDIH